MFKVGKISILSTGPVTDLALLLLSDSSCEVLDRIEIVSQMEGNIIDPCNVFALNYSSKENYNSVAELNVFCDLKAFEIVVNLLGPKLILTTLDAIDLNSIKREYYYQVINNPKTVSGKWFQYFFTNIKNLFTDYHFFNNVKIKGKGFYTWDFESYRTLLNNGCDIEQLAILSIDDNNSPYNPNGRISIINSTTIFATATRICTYINSTLSNSLLTDNYWYLLP